MILSLFAGYLDRGISIKFHNIGKLSQVLSGIFVCVWKPVRKLNGYSITGRHWQKLCSTSQNNSRQTIEMIAFCCLSDTIGKSSIGCTPAYPRSVSRLSWRFSLVTCQRLFAELMDIVWCQHRIEAVPCDSSRSDPWANWKRLICHNHTPKKWQWLTMMMMMVMAIICNKTI